VEVLAISYDQLNELLDQSEVTREVLHQMADRHEQENLKSEEPLRRASCPLQMAVLLISKRKNHNDQPLEKNLGGFVGQ